jgi:hypothetical protein
MQKKRTFLLPNKPSLAPTGHQSLMQGNSPKQSNESNNIKHHIHGEPFKTHYSSTSQLEPTTRCCNPRTSQLMPSCQIGEFEDFAAVGAS